MTPHPPHPRLLYGHRGAPRHAPENTLPSFERALADGANALELDVHVTADGVVVVSHDADARRTAGLPTTIRSASLAQVQRWDVGAAFVAPDGSRPFAGQGVRIPTLEEVLRRFADVPLNVDVKPGALDVVPLVLTAIARAQAAARVTLASFHEATMRAIRLAGYPGGLSLAPNAVRWLALAPAPLRRLFPPHGTAVQVPPRAGPMRLDSRVFIDRVHALGMRVDYWVINDVTQARHLFAAGADGIVSDDPAAVVSALREPSAARPG